MLTVKDLAEKLNIKEATIYAMVRNKYHILDWELMVR